MLRQLDQSPVVCAPIGGESGRAFHGLSAEWGIGLRHVTTSAASPVEISDRRDGDQRNRLARTAPPTLSRHETDELYNHTLEMARAWAAGAANITRRGSGGASAGLGDELRRRVEVERIEEDAG